MVSTSNNHSGDSARDCTAFARLDDNGTSLYTTHTPTLASSAANRIGASTFATPDPSPSWPLALMTSYLRQTPNSNLILPCPNLTKNLPSPTPEMQIGYLDAGSLEIEQTAYS